MGFRDRTYLCYFILILLSVIVITAGQNFWKITQIDDGRPEDKRIRIAWCTITRQEYRKCRNLAMANERDRSRIRVGYDYFRVECIQAFNKEECMGMLDEGQATLTSLDAGEVFVGGRYNSLVPIAQEIAEGGANFYYAVAAIKKDKLPQVQSLYDLRGTRACFAGVQTFAGWVLPIYTLMRQGGMDIVDCNNHVKSATRYFGPSCAVNCLTEKFNPIGDNSDKLCQLCIGRIPGGRCTNADPYSGYEGAFRCLLEAGDVAFLKHSTIHELVSGGEFIGISKDSFELLCKDGSRRPVDDYLSCNWGKVPANAIVTSSATPFDLRKKYQLFLEKAVRIFGGGFSANSTDYNQNPNYYDRDQNRNTDYNQDRNYDQDQNRNNYNNERQPDNYGRRDNNNNQYDNVGQNRFKRQDFGTQNENRYGQNDNRNGQNDNRNEPNDNRNAQNDNRNAQNDNRNAQNDYRSGQNQYDRPNDNNYNNQLDQNNRDRDQFDRDRNQFERDPFTINRDRFGVNIDPYQDGSYVRNRNRFNQTFATTEPPYEPEDNNTFYEVFHLFESTPRYGIHGNLLFQDSTRSFAPLTESQQTYSGFLKESLDVIMGVRACQVNKMTLCVTSDVESDKCVKMKTAMDAQLLKPEMDCYKGHSQIHCMQAIRSGIADVTVLDASDVYTAGLNYDLVPFISEVYDLDEPEYYVVAVGKESDPSTELTYLRDVDCPNSIGHTWELGQTNTQSTSGNILKMSQKSWKDDVIFPAVFCEYLQNGKYTCHGGINTAAGWVYPLAFLISNGWIRPYGCNSIRAAAEYFTKSCVPGALSTEYNTGVPYDNMCDLCHGTSFRYCRRDASEDYYGHTGAFRCLVEGGGQVAFVKHTTVTENTGGKREEWWARDNLNDDFELLCPDGTRAEINEYEKCNLGKVKANAIVTRGGYSYNETHISAFINLFLYAQTFYGRKTSDEFSFSMFSSAPPYTDLIFQDATTQLKVIHSTKRHYAEYLGSDFMRARRIVDCHAGSAFISASLILIMPSLYLLLLS